MVILMAPLSPEPDSVITIDPDAMMRVCYSTISALIEFGRSSETVEVVPGEPQTLVRLWEMPLSSIRLGVLESIYQALVSHPTDDGAFAAATREIIGAWEPIWQRLMDDLDESISVSLDGIALEMGDELHS